MTVRYYIFAHCLMGFILGLQEPVPVPKDYDILFKKIETAEKGSAEQSRYLQIFLKQAKRERNWKEMVNGYKNYLHHSPLSLRQIYADSMVGAAFRSRDTALIGSAYLTKGIVYYSDKKYNDALDNYLLANEHISRTADTYLQYKLTYNMAHLKYYLGYYKEAISLFGDCLAYFKKGPVRPYLNSLHALGLCYNRMGDYGRCTETNQLGLAEGERLGNNSMAAYFRHSEGINQYTKNNYASALDLLKGAMSTIKGEGDFANVAVGHFYIGKSHWALHRPEQALPHFLEVDRSFVENGYIRPDLRENYELLMGYYQQRDRPQQRLYYIERLLQVDSVLNGSFKYLSGKIHKEYDTKRLLQEKGRIQALLHKRQGRDRLWTTAMTVVLLLLGLTLYRYFRNKKRYREKFEALMQKGNSPPTVTKQLARKSSINPEVAAAILKQLERFEKGRKFLEKDLTLVKLAAAFNSNTKYLSMTIADYKGKKFVEYLNDLKVDHITRLMKTDRRLRNYTNSALAEEAGFSTTQRFTNAFFSRNGLSAHHFAQFLKEQEKEDTDTSEG